MSDKNQDEETTKKIQALNDKRDRFSCTRYSPQVGVEALGKMDTSEQRSSRFRRFIMPQPEFS
jgi:hypothetical protein